MCLDMVRSDQAYRREKNKRKRFTVQISGNQYQKI